MVFIILSAVLVMSITRIGARPTEADAALIGVGNEIRYNIPKVIKPGYTIIVNGTLTRDSSIETFTAILADKDDNRDNDCSIVFNIKMASLEIFPPSSPDYRIMENVPQLSPAFSMKILARVSQSGDELFGVAFNGMQDSLNCVISNMENIGYIVIKEGVENVNNMFFEFS